VTLAVAILWRREVTRFVRQRSRVVGALAQPIVFWLLLGGGLSASFRPPGAAPGTSYLAYLYPGILALVLLFTAIFATIATVEDRQTGFLQGVLVAPVGRAAIVVGQALGATTLAVGQGLLFLVLAPLAGVAVGPGRFLAAAGVMTVVAFGLTNLGLLIAWRMESTQGFHAIMNLLLIPIWLLSGAFFPPTGVARPLAWLMTVDPLTYGLAALRACLDPPSAATLPPLPLSLGVAVAFAGVACAGAVATAARGSAAG
jgi:ABC-2 type transport system permease protein